MVSYPPCIHNLRIYYVRPYTPNIPELITYLREHSVQEPELLKALRLETLSSLEAAPMQISPEQGQFFRFLLQTMNAKRS